MSEWTDHVAQWKDCTRCPLAQQRFRICLARGDVPCDVVFVGEAPGERENDVGQPFKGPAGRLLDEIIAFGVPAGITYALTNLVACYPRNAKLRGDNEPEPDEIKACRPRLVQFVRLCRPRLIVLVGGLAQRNIYGASMFRLDGADGQPEWIPPGQYLHFVDIIHPAAILKREMPLAKKNFAAQQASVAIRCAIEDVLAGDDTKQGERHADITTSESIRRDHDHWTHNTYTDADIPF